MNEIDASVPEATIKRIQADVLEDEAKKMRRTVKKLRTGDPKGDVTRAVAAYLEGRAETLRLMADTLEVKP